jgi:hypothetical protein
MENVSWKMTMMDGDYENRPPEEQMRSCKMNTCASRSNMMVAVAIIFSE